MLRVATMKKRSVLTVASLLLACRFVAAQGLTVAAASDLQSALPEMAARFEKETGQQVRLIFGSSATSSRRLRTGRPSTSFCRRISTTRGASKARA